MNMPINTNGLTFAGKDEFYTTSVYPDDTFTERWNYVGSRGQDVQVIRYNQDPSQTIVVVDGKVVKK